MSFYQHDDEVIYAARALRKAIIDDAPYGNTEAATDWFYRNYAQVGILANQKTEREEFGKLPKA